MEKVWLITNSNSGSYDAALCDRIGETIAAHGGTFDRCIRLPDHDLPSAADVRAAGVDIVAIFTGDGTINAGVARLEGWDGDVLVLPGGTMNLLSKELHGDVPVMDIVARALEPDVRRERVPVVAGCGQKALVGIIAGPTAAWVDVREGLRAMDVKTLAEAVPEAISETFRGDLVHLDGDSEEYQAIYIQPLANGLEARGIRAQNAADLLKHGWAWLTGDFRKGPADILRVAPDITVECDSEIGLLIDGEKVEASRPCTFRWEESGLRFIATRQAEQEPES